MVWKRETIQWAAVVWMKMSCWCQRRMDRLVRDDRKTTVTQITTRYNQGVQKTISEHTTCRTLKQMGSSSRRTHRCRSGQIRTGHGGAHFWPLKTNWASVKRHSLPEYCCWPGSSLYYIYIAIGQFTNGSSQWTFNSILINAAKKIKCSFFFIWANSVLSCGPHKRVHPLKNLNSAITLYLDDMLGFFGDIKFQQACLINYQRRNYYYQLLLLLNYYQNYSAK